MRILVTGGSGFIGTNLVEFLLDKNIKVLNIDINSPQDNDHLHIYKRVDICDFNSLHDVFKDFKPNYVLHLAARTDLHASKSLDEYRANTTGVKNMVNAISTCPSVKRAIFCSSKLVCPNDYTPKSDDEYFPDSLYGKSKVVGEKIVKENNNLSCEWCIVRPTSIWGPWSLRPHMPYGRYFLTIYKKRYFHLGDKHPMKNFGYVGNVVYQLFKLLTIPEEQMHRKVFYLTDFYNMTIEEWANMISLKLHGKKPYRIPEHLVRMLAVAGDISRRFGIQEPPMSTFRLRNMRADTSHKLWGPTEAVVGELPYSLEKGVDETIAWFKSMSIFK
jgi:nucleoside-diphosphate-sugar epimerase